MGEMPLGIRSLLGPITDLKSEDRILIVTDTDKFQIGKELFDWASKVNETSIAVMTPRASHGDEPTVEIAAAMETANVIFAATSMSMFHSQARRRVVQNGHCRYVNLVDYIPSMFHEGGLTADFLEITEILNRIAPHFRGKKVELSSPGGTNLVCSVEGREPVIDYGRSIRPGQSSSPPNAEIALGPVEGTAQGVLVIDGSIPHPSLNMIREPITMHVEDGQIVMISGTNEADTVRRILEQYKDSRVYNIGEVGLPVNRENKICGRMLADEGAYGTVHIGIGNNLSFGGNVEAPLHMDMVIRDITLKIDGRIISQNGILQI